MSRCSSAGEKRPRSFAERKAIAAKREIPHYFLTETADLHDSLLRRRVKARAKGHASDKPQLL
jgi:hypothetical protein